MVLTLNNLQETDHNYYNHLLNEFPQGLVTVPIIMHCLVEQVAAYDWPVEDIKAIEVANLNKVVRDGIFDEFEKLGHPRWVGLQRDAPEGLETRFDMMYNFARLEGEATLATAGSDNKVGFPGEDRFTQGKIFILVSRGNNFNCNLFVNPYSQGTHMKNLSLQSISFFL